MYTLQHSELSGFDLEEDARSEEDGIKFLLV